MAELPADVGTGIVRVRLRQVGLVSSDTPETSALPVRGKVVFTPNTPLLRHVGDGLLFSTKPVAAYLDVNGDVSVELMATNDAQLEPLGWTYEVSFVLDNAEISPFHIVVEEGTDVELSDVTPVPPGTALPPSSGGGGAPTGAAGGDLAGTYPNPTVVAASTTAAGKVELATNAEAMTGTDTARAVTPAGVRAALDIGVTAVTAAYPLVLADAHKAVEVDSATPVSITVPLNATVAFPVGTLIEVYQRGAGQVSIAPTGGVTVESRGGLLDLAGQYAVASLRKRATDIWVLTGDLS